MKQTKYFCDICKKELDKKWLGVLRSKFIAIEEKDFKIQIPVVFTTEENEGRALSFRRIKIYNFHICEKCYDKIVKEGKQVFGEGAMGYNTYWFKKG